MCVYCCVFFCVHFKIWKEEGAKKFQNKSLLTFNKLDNHAHNYSQLEFDQCSVLDIMVSIYNIYFHSHIGGRRKRWMGEMLPLKK